MPLKIGTAGWNVPRDIAHRFHSDGSSLTRYASRFPVAEINSSFHRAHREATWKRWRDSVPPAFRFSVKVPKLVSHSNQLVGCSHLVDDFLEQAGALGSKLAVLLVQLPPKLIFDNPVATAFFAYLRDRTNVGIACEPRHPSWFTSEVNALFEQLQIARVAADPAISDLAKRPGGWAGLRYWRLHGSPVFYRSSYADRIERLACTLMHEASAPRDVWCIFDNTASSAGAADALALAQAIST